MVSLPLGTVYSGRATRKAPQRRTAVVALVLSLLALLGLAAVIILNLVT